MNVNDKCYLVYDARPVEKTVKIYAARVTKVTPAGRLRIQTNAKNERGHPVYDELFDNKGKWGWARGWNTLKWQLFIPRNPHNVPMEVIEPVEQPV